MTKSHRAITFTAFSVCCLAIAGWVAAGKQDAKVSGSIADPTLQYPMNSSSTNEILDHCYTCPDYDQDISPDTSWNTHGPITVNEGYCYTYRAYLYAQTPYRFTVCGNGGSFSGDPYIYLFDSSCAFQVWNGDYCSLGFELDYTPSSSGWYFLQILSFSPSITYTLAYGYFAGCTGCDDWDYSITPTIDYQTHSSTVGWQSCRQYRVYMNSDYFYRFSFCEGGGQADFETTLILRDEECAYLDMDDSYCSNQSQLDFQPNVTGYYWLEVDRRNIFGGAYTLAYKYYDHCYSCPTFDYWFAVQNTYQTHGPIHLDSTTCRWYQWYLFKNTPYRFTVCGGGGSNTESVYLELYESNCAYDTYNWPCGDGGEQVDFTPSDSGLYLLKVSPSSVSLDYTLAYSLFSSCVSCPSYDYWLSVTEDYQTHTCEIGLLSCKLYVAQLFQNYSYRFTFCEGGGEANFDTHLRLMNSTCNIVAESDDFCGTLSQLDFVMTGPTDYYFLEVTSPYPETESGVSTLAYKYTVPTPAPTPTPGTGSLEGNVSFERPGVTPPDPSWSMTVDLELCSSNTLIESYSVTTDQEGYFNIDVQSGTFDVFVKNEHALANWTTAYIPTGGSSEIVSFGALREGDANNDNMVTSADFFILKATYNLSQGDPGYDDRADFNENQMVTSSDFFLLRNHYNEAGESCEGSFFFDGEKDASKTNSKPGFVTIALKPIWNLENLTGKVDIEVWAYAGEQEIDSIDVHLDFFPANLHIDDISGIEYSNCYEMQRAIDNPRGKIDYAAVSFESLTGDILICTIHATEISKSHDVNLTFAFDPMTRKTRAEWKGIDWCQQNVKYASSKSTPFTKTSMWIRQNILNRIQ